MTPPAPLRILLVEDNAINQKIAGKLLELLGHACEVAASGKECLKRVSQRKYDLIFLDIELPDLSGYEVMRQLRESEMAVSAKVIALTAFTHADDLARSRDAGMIDHLTKPLNRERLKAAIERAVG